MTKFHWGTSLRWLLLQLWNSVLVSVTVTVTVAACYLLLYLRAFCATLFDFYVEFYWFHISLCIAKERHNWRRICRVHLCQFYVNKVNKIDTIYFCFYSFFCINKKINEKKVKQKWNNTKDETIQHKSKRKAFHFIYGYIQKLYYVFIYRKHISINLFLF